VASPDTAEQPELADRRLRPRIDAALDRYVRPDDGCPAHLAEAIRYVLLGAGKRLRPELVLLAAEACGGSIDQAMPAACAVEMVHAYSLVHDDLPAMDDDDLRRGRPACHKAFDEATAILAGDALQSLAFKVLTTDDGLPERARVQMVGVLACASGSRGMAGGQALDLEAEGRELDLVQLENIHIHKTGALIRSAVMLASMCADDPAPKLARSLAHYGACIGLAFQIRDDILDVDGDPSVLGKTRGKDATQDKVTYPALLGLAGAREKAQQLHAEAVEQLSSLDHRADALRHLADYIVGRAY